MHAVATEACIGAALAAAAPAWPAPGLAKSALVHVQGDEGMADRLRWQIDHEGEWYVDLGWHSGLAAREMLK